MNISSEIKGIIKDVPDFPKKGIIFKDITPILLDAKLMRRVINALARHFSNDKIDVVLGIESRGFAIAAPVALNLGVGLALVRKVGKLPREKISQTYKLEYGENILEIHKDAVQKNQKVLIIDDLLATGGTALAAAELVRKLGARTVGFAFIVDLHFLGGLEKLKQKKYKVLTLASL